MLYLFLTAWSFVALVSAFAATALYLEHKPAWRGVLLMGACAPVWIAIHMMIGVGRFFHAWWLAVRIALKGE